MEINGAVQLGEVMVKEDEWTCPVCKKTYRARDFPEKREETVLDVVWSFHHAPIFLYKDKTRVCIFFQCSWGRFP